MFEHMCHTDFLREKSDPKPPKVIRVLFGDILETKNSVQELDNIKLRNELDDCIAMDLSAVWDLFGGKKNIYYFVCGNKNAEYLKNKGVINVTELSPSPFIEPIGISYWYNKTKLIEKAFEEFGMEAEILYLDFDIQIKIKPDARLSFLLREKKTKSHILSPVRFYPGIGEHNRGHLLRRPLAPEDSNQTNPQNCFIYCNNGRVISEILQCYEDITKQFGPRNDGFEGGDEETTMYWFDKKNGIRSTQEIVDAFEPISVITLKKVVQIGKAFPKESWDIKNLKDVYFWHA
jgi:hypothetical protein